MNLQKNKTVHMTQDRIIKVLVACEYSGKVRDAFISKGHDVISCDLLPTDIPGPHLKKYKNLYL